MENNINIFQNNKWENEIYNILKNIFHLQHFREGQKEIILSILSGKDCFILAPTGGIIINN